MRSAQLVVYHKASHDLGRVRYHDAASSCNESKRPGHACLAFVDEGHVKLFISAVTLDEIREVLNRPDIRRSFRKLTDENVLDFLDQLVGKSQMVEDVPRVYRYDRDPDDEPFLNLAIAIQRRLL